MKAKDGVESPGTTGRSNMTHLCSRMGSGPADRQSRDSLNIRPATLPPEWSNFAKGGRNERQAQHR
jgi:hypothetical protein